MIQHRRAHAPDAGAALFHEMEKYEALADERVAGAGTRFAFFETFQRGMSDRQTGVGDDDAVEIDLDDDVLTGVFVVAVSKGVDEGFAEGGFPDTRAVRFA
jgi:hypothetical protein